MENPNKAVKIEKVWGRNFKKNVYICAICHLSGSSAPDIIGCAFSAEMKAFNLKGNEVFSSDFSPDITSFRTGAISEINKIELVSGDLDGYIRVMDRKGESIWFTKLEAPVTCIKIGDIHGDGKSAIIAGLENHKLIGLDSKGAVFFKFDANEPILDFAIFPPLVHSSDFHSKIAVLLKSGNVMEVNIDGKSQVLFQIEDVPSCMTAIDLSNKPYFITGNKQGFLEILDRDGEIIEKQKMGTSLKCVDSYQYPQKPRNEVLLGIASEDVIYLFKLTKMKEEAKPLVKIIPPQPKSDSTISQKETIQEELKQKTNNVEIPVLIPSRDKITFDQKTRLFGMIKVEKRIKLTEANQYLGMNKNDIKGLIYDLVGEGKIDGEFQGEDFIISSDVNDFIEALDASFEDWKKKDSKI